MKTTRASLITKCVILILIVYLSITLLNVRGKLQTASDDCAALQAQVTAQEAENAALEERLENQDDPDTVLAIALIHISCTTRLGSGGNPVGGVQKIGG
ncbi:MAG: septum formation initiator family protein, partial [Clostridiales bacterium]|nr:septum formation initiator family protein [Clostridiales bacterium]